MWQTLLQYVVCTAAYRAPYCLVPVFSTFHPLLFSLFLSVCLSIFLLNSSTSFSLFLSLFVSVNDEPIWRIHGTGNISQGILTFLGFWIKQSSFFHIGDNALIFISFITFLHGFFLTLSHVGILGQLGTQIKCLCLNYICLHKMC